MSETPFYTAVDAIFKNWTALQLIVKQGEAGPQGASIAKWMVSATVQWFSENKNLEYDEVEDFLFEIVWNEFSVELQDGSEKEISKLLCDFYKLYTSLDGEDEFKRRLLALPKCDLSKCQVKDIFGPPKDGQIDSQNAFDLVQTCPNSSKLVFANKSEQEPQPEEKDPDGWEVVKPQKKKNKFKNRLTELSESDVSKSHVDEGPSEEPSEEPSEVPSEILSEEPSEGLSERLSKEPNEGSSEGPSDGPSEELDSKFPDENSANVIADQLDQSLVVQEPQPEEKS